MHFTYGRRRPPQDKRYNLPVSRTPAHFADIAHFIEENLDAPVALTCALAALLGDPEIYGSSKGRPLGALTDFVHELLIRDRALGEFVKDPLTPVSRVLIDGKWNADWRGLRGIPAEKSRTPEFDVCISYAGEDREVAERIASSIKRNKMKRKVFYDEFEKVKIWGEELASYLHRIYSEDSKFCVILFSHAYSRKVWTRHEYRSALTRAAQEQGSYVLPIAIDAAAIPDEIATVGYWRFEPGSEKRIAKAVEEKINEYIGEHYISLEEITKLINADRAARAILDGIREGIQERTTAADRHGTEVLTVLALIVAADTAHLDKSARAIIDLILFSPGLVGNSFQDESFHVTGEASIQRWLGHQGPFLFSANAWEKYFARYRIGDDEEGDVLGSVPPGCPEEGSD